MTNDAGEWVLLTSEEFDAFLAGDIEAGHPKYVEFSSKGFVRSNFDLDDMANKVRRKKAFLNQKRFFNQKEK